MPTNAYTGEVKIINLASAFLAIYVLLFCFPTFAKKEIKNFIYLIGDGMGPQQIALATLYARKAPHSVVKGRKLNIERFMAKGQTGLSLNYPVDGLVIDSACSATQLATGKPSVSEALGVDSKGNAIPTVIELAKASGRATGLVSDTRITHATPAAFATHVAHRSMENEIAAQLVYSSADVLLSGGLRYFLPANIKNKDTNAYKDIRSLVPAHLPLTTKRFDNRNLLSEAQQNGFQLVFDRKQLSQAKGQKLLGLFAEKDMPDGITHTQTKNDRNRKIPTLKEMTEKALAVLAKNPNGFFLMVEAGQIDWAGHQNDAGNLLHEMLRFDETIGYVLDWAQKRDDTLVVLTADHETGSFGLSYNAKNIATPKALTGNAFQQRIYQPNFNFGSGAVLDNLYAQKQSLTKLVDEFKLLPSPKQNAEQLVKLVKRDTGFSLGKKEAEEMLTEIPNEYYVPGHKYLGKKTLPYFGAYGAFYVIENLRIGSSIARAIAEQQNVVWGTGTHTSTPVIVVAHGPKWATDVYDGFHTADKIGALTLQSMGLDKLPENKIKKINSNLQELLQKNQAQSGH